MKNPYEPIKTQILQVIPETPQIKTFVLKLENHFEFNAGQFIQLTVPGVGEAPFTPSSSPYEKEKIEVRSFFKFDIRCLLFYLSGDFSKGENQDSRCEWY